MNETRTPRSRIEAMMQGHPWPLTDTPSPRWQYNDQRGAWELFASPFCAVIDSQLEIDDDSGEDPVPVSYSVEHAADERDGGTGYDTWKDGGPLCWIYSLAGAMQIAEALMSEVRAEAVTERRRALFDAAQAVMVALPRGRGVEPGELLGELEGMTEAATALIAATEHLAAVA